MVMELLSNCRIIGTTVEESKKIVVLRGRDFAKDEFYMKESELFRKLSYEGASYSVIFDVEINGKSKIIVSDSEYMGLKHGVYIEPIEIPCKNYMYKALRDGYLLNVIDIPAGISADKFKSCVIKWFSKNGYLDMVCRVGRTAVGVGLICNAIDNMVSVYIDKDKGIIYGSINYKGRLQCANKERDCWNWLTDDWFEMFIDATSSLNSPFTKGSAGNNYKISAIGVVKFSDKIKVLCDKVRGSGGYVMYKDWWGYIDEGIDYSAGIASSCDNDIHSFGLINHDCYLINATSDEFEEMNLYEYGIKEDEILKKMDELMKSGKAKIVKMMTK